MRKVLLVLAASALSFAADTGAAMSQAQAAINHGEFVNAEQILNAAMKDLERRAGPKSSALDAPLEMLAQVYQWEKKYSQEVAVHQRRIDIWADMFGDNAVVVGRILGQLAMAERQAGNLVDAEKDSRRALSVINAAFGAQPPTARAQMDLTDVLLAQGFTFEAEQTLAMAQRLLESAMGPDSVLTIEAAVRRAPLLRQLGKGAEADQLPNKLPLAAAGVYKVGGSGENRVTPPRIQSKNEPQYSEEARKRKLQGSITLCLVVDATGAPTQIAILRPLGMGLDQQAIDAISHWKFVPGSKNGAPVAVYTQIDITFRLL